MHPLGTVITTGTIDGHLIVLNSITGLHVTTVRVCGSPLSCLAYNSSKYKSNVLKYIVSVFLQTNDKTEVKIFSTKKFWKYIRTRIIDIFSTNSWQHFGCRLTKWIIVFIQK